ncbi:MAG: YbjN domain-containing protein [Gemmatimonadaceae bacterium]
MAIGPLDVASRTSAFAFKGNKGNKEDITAIGRKLKVHTVLEGSVRKAGNRLRISALMMPPIDTPQTVRGLPYTSSQRSYWLSSLLSRSEMSVLVEALTLVVPRSALDISFPGATDGFLEALSDPAVDKRFVCSDDHLVSVSFMSPAALEPVARRLTAHGLVEMEDSGFREFALVDQHFGPTMPCEWLVWKRHDEGYTTAWIATSEPGELAKPEGWTPAQSRQLSRSDVRDQTGWGMRLAEENGIETWLDFTTGRISVGLSHRSETAPRPVGPQSELGVDSYDEPVRGGAGHALLQVVHKALDEFGWRYQSATSGTAVVFRVAAEHVPHDFFVSIDEEMKVVVCYLNTSFRVPEAIRPAVCELLTRANYGLRIGNLEMDMSDGEVRYKTSIDVDGGTLTTRMVKILIASASEVFDIYFPAVMKVVYGNQTPEEAIREVEATG